MSTSEPELEQCYQLLGLTPPISLADLEVAYRQLSYQQSRAGAEPEAIELLKAAYLTLEQHLRSQGAQPEAPPAATMFVTPMEQLVKQLRQLDPEAQAKIQNQQLHIGFNVARVSKPQITVARVYTLLANLEDRDADLATVQTVFLYGLKAPKEAAWRETFPMPQALITPDDLDPYSFNNRFSSILFFPVLLLLGMLVNAFPLTRTLLQGIKIWIHEFGHATVAWFAGRRAIPLPFGWTNVQPERSLFVYFGVLILLGLLFWTGRREGKRWPMVLAVILAGLQFWLTWMASTDRFMMFLAFGGIGGEFYLSTLLMVSFYFPMPDYWRWEFWRYPVVFGAAFTFWGSVGMWHQIERGRASIPWGSLWGGREHSGGDMNILHLDYGWSDQQIITTYNTLSGLCLTALLSIYFYFLLKQNRQFFFSLWQQFLART